MRLQNAFPTVAFCIAAAVMAAAVSDPIVEWMSNRGAFGPGNFTDHSTRDVVPALCTAFLISVLLVVGFVRRAAFRSAATPRWLRKCVLASSARTLPRLMPAIFALQILLLWSMESAEQIAVAGRPLGGEIWLGGPAVVSLAVHAAGCVIVTLLLARMLRWSAEAIVDVVTFIRQLLCAVLRAPVIRSSRAQTVPVARSSEPLLARLSGRAPPDAPRNPTALASS